MHMPKSDNDKNVMHTILESLPGGVMVVDADGRIILMNPACKRYLNLAPETETGRPPEAYVDDHGLCAQVRDVLSADCRTKTETADYEFAIGPERYLLARLKRLPGPAGGAVVTLADITAQKVLERLKGEFVAKVTHELRSPLSTIHDQLATLIHDLSGQLSSDDAHLLSRAKEKTQGLIDLVGDLLDLSRIEAGAVCQEPKPVILEELLENIVDFLGARAAAKRQWLTMQLPGEKLPPVKADPLALESIFGNLIINAINYTPEEGAIQIEAAAEGDRIRVTVTDSGFGIEPHHLEKIFDRFYRVKNERTRFITGTGLGLPIVKGLVASLGGTVAVESTLGKGSVFTVTIPV